MRLFTLFVIVLAAQLTAHDAPRKVARKAPVARLKPTPLSPEKLRGQIAFVREGDLWVINPKTRAQTLILQGESIRSSQDIDISPDLTKVIIGGEAGELKVRSLNGGKPFNFTVPASIHRRGEVVDAGQVSSLRWSPDGTHISYVLATASEYRDLISHPMQLRVMNADGTGDHLLAGRTREGGSLLIWSAVWGRDGTRLLFDYYIDDPTGSEKRTIAIDGSDEQPFDGKINRFAALNVSRDAQRWLGVSPEGGLQICSDAKPEYPGQYPQNFWFVEFAGLFLKKQEMTFSADGQQILFGATLNPVILDIKGKLIYPDPYTSALPTRAISGLFLRTQKVDQLLVKNAALVKWL